LLLQPPVKISEPLPHAFYEVVFELVPRRLAHALPGVDNHIYCAACKLSIVETVQFAKPSLAARAYYGATDFS
jgi:hypothetical protein